MLPLAAYEACDMGKNTILETLVIQQMGLSVPNSTQKLSIATSMQVSPTSCCHYGAVIISRVKGEGRERH